MHTLIVAVSKNKNRVEELLAAASILSRQGLLEFFPVEYLDDPNNIMSLWSNVGSADMVLCLESAALLRTFEKYHNEQSTLVEDALQNRKADGGLIIPIVLTPCEWDQPGHVCHKLGALPQDRPISKYSDSDDAWHDVALGLRSIAENTALTSKNPTLPYQNSVARNTQVVSPPFCNRCGDRLDPGSVYCVSCGTQIVPKPARNRAIGVLFSYAPYDLALVQECRKFLEAPGINIRVFDEKDVISGSGLPGWVVSKLPQIDAVIYFTDADLIALSSTYNRVSILSQTFTDIPDTILEKSYKVILRPCMDDYFLPIVPNTIMTLDGREFASSRNREASWKAFAKQLKNDLQ